MPWIPEDRETDCAELEKRCQHFEKVIGETIDLLRLVIKDFAAPLPKPILGPLTERLNSIVVFLEAAPHSVPKPVGSYPYEEP